MIPEQASGTCVGGPWHGKHFAHTSKTKELFRPIGDGYGTVVGEYRLNDYGQWIWWPTKEWEAADVLFGPPE